MPGVEELETYLAEAREHYRLNPTQENAVNCEKIFSELKKAKNQPTEVVQYTTPEPFPLEVRAEREEALRSNPEQWDERSPIEKLFDCLTAARLAYYRPMEEPSMRRDIICLCCGIPYRPDNILDGENMFLCLSCIGERLGK